MDGTLLNSHGELPAHFARVLKKLQKRNILFAIASGRQYFTLLENFKAYQESLLFIAENGTFIAYKGQELAVHPLEKDIAHRLISRGRELGVELVLATSKGAYLESKNERFLKEVAKYYVKHEVVEDLFTIEGDILKVTVCDFRGAEQYSLPYYQEFAKEAQICIAGEIWLDMMANGVNKGRAIEDIQDRLGITYHETMVFGDYLNDVEMLQSAYYSYAMENAHPKLKKIARFITKSNDDNGVLEKIQEIV